ncbi:hypothetical protein FBU31_001563 [Coemansia sp. 'formosensis']|nr:hypothetical protein FBU31_001563 [Coemansia sp. 'formosensis']
MSGDQFESLFEYKPLTYSLKILDISLSYIRASSILYVLVGMPKLTKLVLIDTRVDNNVMLAISRVMLDLEWLNVRYFMVTESGFEELAKGCQKLMYLECDWYQNINDSEWLRQMRARGAYVKVAWDYESDESVVSDWDNDDYNLVDLVADGFYSDGYDYDN